MDGSFACPECGFAIEVSGNSAGRQVECAWCHSLVEVPYIPRSGAKRRRIRRRQRIPGFWSGERLPRWAKPVVVALVVAIAGSGLYRYVQYRWETGAAAALRELIKASDKAEGSGSSRDAIAAIESALAYAKAMDPAPPGLTELQARRDQLARREAEDRLADLEALRNPLDPGLQVGRALTLRARRLKDPALAGLEDRIDAALARMRTYRAEDDLREASLALGSDRHEAALELCRRGLHASADLSRKDQDRLLPQLREIASKVISSRGIVIEPVRGQFTLGGPEAYGEAMKSSLLYALRERGYVPKVGEPAWDDLWDNLAPYHLTVTVLEAQDDVYMASPNRKSSLEAQVTLLLRGRPAWIDTARGRTQSPLPGVAAYPASRLAVSDRRNPEFERLLYQNAWERLFERLQSTFRKLPPGSSLTPLSDPSS